MKLKDDVEVIIVRDDWEKFVQSLERLMALHEQLLQRLIEVNRRNEALNGELRAAFALRSPNPTSEGYKAPTVVAKKPFLSRLTNLLQPRKFQSVGFARCGKCGFTLPKPGRFCQHCHTSFDSLVCTCGRDLDDKDKFCDRCGRKLMDQSAI